MTANTPFIPVVQGSARKERESIAAARFTKEQAEQYGFESELVDPRDHLTVSRTIASWQDDEEKSKEWKDIAERADGFLLVVPEYNHGYPGELKLLLDQQYKAYFNKPVGICGVSAGGMGGARVVEHLKPVLVEYHMVPVRNAMYFSGIGDAFDEDGNPTDKQMAEYLQSVFEEMEWYANRLKVE